MLPCHSVYVLLPEPCITYSFLQGREKAKELLSCIIGDSTGIQTPHFTPQLCGPLTSLHSHADPSLHSTAMQTPHFTLQPCRPLTLLHCHADPSLHSTAMWPPHFTPLPCRPLTLLHCHADPSLYSTAMRTPHFTPLVSYNLPRPNTCIEVIKYDVLLTSRH